MERDGERHLFRGEAVVGTAGSFLGQPQGQGRAGGGAVGFQGRPQGRGRAGEASGGV